MNNKTKISILSGSMLFTLAIHYGLILEPLFGDSHWIHAVHGRFCYIPIVIGASWFGIRGGLISAFVISLIVLPYIFFTEQSDHNLSGELVEIVFYFAIGILTGAIFDREILLRKKHEETELKLERSHRLSMLGRMTASIAHEIKNPLASLKGAVEIVNNDQTDINDKKEFGTIAVNEIKRIDNTVSEFLEYARPRQPQLTNLNLHETLQSVVKQLSSQTESNQVTLNPANNNDLFIYADREKIHQVILNLILNALQSSSDNTPITITTGTNNNMAFFKIIDNGDGIPTENIGKIFDPFFTTKTSGTGLGLAVVKSIIENQNGTIEINSELNQGTTVTVHMPISAGVSS